MCKGRCRSYPRSLQTVHQAEGRGVRCRRSSLQEHDTLQGHNTFQGYSTLNNQPRRPSRNTVFHVKEKTSGCKLCGNISLSRLGPDSRATTGYSAEAEDLLQLSEYRPFTQKLPEQAILQDMWKKTQHSPPPE